MEKTTISVMEASRSFADCVNRAHYQNVTFVLLKDGFELAFQLGSAPSGGGQLCCQPLVLGNDVVLV